MAKTEDAISFSPREMEVLALAWQCFDSEPKIDIKKLAQLTGYTEGSAGVTMGKIKRKLKLHAAATSDNSNNGPTPATPTSTSKKGTAAAKTPKSSKRNAGSMLDESSSKKKKKKGDSSAGPSAEDCEKLEEGDELKIKPEPGAEDGFDDGFGAYDGYGGYNGYGAYQAQEEEDL